MWSLNTILKADELIIEGLAEGVTHPDLGVWGAAAATFPAQTIISFNFSRFCFNSTKLKNFSINNSSNRVHNNLFNLNTFW